MKRRNVFSFLSLPTKNIEIRQELVRHRPRNENRSHGTPEESQETWDL